MPDRERLPGNRTDSDQEKTAPDKSASAAPAISLPKGGGAIRGIGEKFAANPVTGAGSMSVPIATSPGRSGFGPQLSLSYDSGVGNGPFGFGWSLSLPAITRKTDKGLPQYRDADESDVFILSGAEDLVPALVEIEGQWQRETLTPRLVEGQAYQIQRYRPRIEGLFARIERWTNQTDPQDTFWRSISRDNITTWYGKTGNSRIADPSDPSRVFSWLICESHDDKGNVISYKYKEEDSSEVNRAQAHERNRDDQTRSANRYLKRIYYGNLTPYFPQSILEQPPAAPEEWLFEVVFDYGEHDQAAPAPNDAGVWPCRNDPFSSYRAGFEVRTYRLCQRVLMFHHFPNEPGVGTDCLVRSTDFTYSYEQNPADARNPIFSFLLSVTQSGYKRQDSGYLKRSLPPLEFEYTQATIQEEIEEVGAKSLENLPNGLDGFHYQWLDLDGEGLSGILTEQAEGWFYKRNLSPSNLVREDDHERTVARFGPQEVVVNRPAANLVTGQGQFLDLAGDGQVDLVQMEGPAPGFYERTANAGWANFRPFVSWPNLDTRDPNLKFVDLTGDGHADVLISENEVFTWHPSLAEAGFGPAEKVQQTLDEEKGPKLVFADGAQSIYLADMSGDGLADLVRLRNGEACYWPNLGYGRFGMKVTMDNAPWLDHPDLFDQRRIHLADIDGSGVTDIIYLGRDGMQVYFNQSGNGWAAAQTIPFPRVDNLAAVQALDLLGNGTACLVWSSPLPGDASRCMRYVKLMGEQKPHLLVKMVNNLGAETHVHYAPSTRFYLADKEAGRPWITRLPFPVHVVERVETYDRISRNRFVSRYAYHHGYFDGEEREFRGFGLVEQWDTEEFAVLSGADSLAQFGGEGWGEGATNNDEASHVPPMLTKTWFHTGAYVGRDHVSDFFAGLLDMGDRGEYYREPAWLADDVEARLRLLPDTILPDGLSLDEEPEASRALKGSMLRQEVYALDGSGTEDYPYGHPYTVVEQNFTIKRLQSRDGNRHAVFFTHPREAISYHYERDPDDPRLGHALTLEVDPYGNVLRSLTIGYGRRQSPLAEQRDRDRQITSLITYTENSFTNAIDDVVRYPDDYHAPLPAETQTYELTGFTSAGDTMRFSFNDFAADDFAPFQALAEIPYEQTPNIALKRKRLIECVRTLYRSNDLTRLLPKCQLESLALPGESYKLVFTPGLLDIYAPQIALAELQTILHDEGKYVDLDGDGRWWIPSGRLFYHPVPGVSSEQELAEAQAHFFLPRRYQNPFDHNTNVDYDGSADPNAPRYDLLVTRTTDPLDNQVYAEHDYRVLQPWRLTDPNGNHTEVFFDVLGLVVGTAIIGKNGEGDSLEEFRADLEPDEIDRFFALPRLVSTANQPSPAAPLLDKATTRIIYDLNRYQRWMAQPQPPDSHPPPVFAATIARETHVSDLQQGELSKLQVSFSYSDGFGREIQKKIQAEPGPIDGVWTDPRWVGSGWTIFNNKGKPVQKYEPFFDNTHDFRSGHRAGVSSTLFYDPAERVIATLHPNHTYEKIVFDPWQQVTYDVNDTAASDPRLDPDVSGYVAKYFEAQPLDWSTWYEQRLDGEAGSEEQDAAVKTLTHADTPTTAHFDALGRPFLTIAHNKFDRARPDGTLETVEETYATRVELDIEGNQRAVLDARERVVMRYDYDMLGNRIHQISMEAGARWTLNNVAGNPIRAWDDRHSRRRITYDALQRPVLLLVSEDGGPEFLAEKTRYGESKPHPEETNHRSQVWQIYDGAGFVTSVVYDCKGNLLHSTRQLLTDYKEQVNWAQNPSPALESEVFTSRSRYDALNRPIQLVAPHSDRQGARINVIRPGYNEANLLERVDAWLGQEAEPGDLLDPATATLSAVTNVDYNAKGQRNLIAYGNGARMQYEYDPETFRLIHLFTTRDATFPDDCPRPPQPPCGLQNLRYTYDPVGNITCIRDDAQQTVFFANTVVAPYASYTYDALYRLITATGREHIGQLAAPETTWNDEFRIGRPHPHDGRAMRTYVEEYEYDQVGNILKVIHRALNGSWTRAYHYDEPSLIELARTSNRLSSTEIGHTVERYFHDAHGNMTQMPHLPVMEWDFKDQLHATQRQVVNGGVGEQTYYVYDAAGQRVRKVTERIPQDGSAPRKKAERLYLGSCEVYQKYNGNGETVILEYETLHLTDDTQRIALVDTKIVDSQSSIPNPRPLIRYQFGNHLGSASLELDDQAQVISYEEYYPYGSTSYQAARSGVEVSQKRYRYTGKERDEESGLNYHAARYYSPWLGRWTSCDPGLLADGPNPYVYVRSAPTMGVDRSGFFDPNQQSCLLRTESTGLHIGIGSLEARASDLRQQLAIPEPRGWPHRNPNRRIDFSQWYPGTQNMIRVQRLGQQIAARDERVAGNVVDQLTALAFTLSTEEYQYDKALVLAIAYRETGDPILDLEGRISTYRGGGLDQIWTELHARRHPLIVPEGYNEGRNRWRPPTRSEEEAESNELGGGIAPASIPRSELIVAYGSVIHRRMMIFLEEAKAQGFDVRNLPPRTLRVWTTIFFGAQGGRVYGTEGRIGGITILTHLRNLQTEQGQALDLNAVLTRPELRDYILVQRGLVSAGDAEMIEESLLF